MAAVGGDPGLRSSTVRLLRFPYPIELLLLLFILLWGLLALQLLLPLLLVLLLLHPLPFDVVEMIWSGADCQAARSIESGDRASSFVE